MSCRLKHVTPQRKKEIEELIQRHLKTGIDLLHAINIPEEEDLDDFCQDLTNLVDEFNDEEVGVPKLEPA